MRLNRWLGVLILLLSGVWSVRAQDLLPACPQVDKGTKACKPMREPGSLGDTVSVKIVFPVAFKGVGRNEVVDSLGILAPVLEHLRLVQNGSSEDTVRIVHIGDSDLLDKHGDKAQGERHYHGESMHRHFYHFQWREQTLQSVGEHSGRGCIGQQRADDNEQDYTHGSEYRGINACGRYGYFPE